MINYEEELKKFKPCLDVDEIESAVYTGSDRYRGYPAGDAENREKRPERIRGKT